MFLLGPIALLLTVLTHQGVALESNNEGSPQVLSDMSSSNACKSQGRTSTCEIELDVPSACVTNGRSTCPVVFYLHGAGGKITGFKRKSGVHKYGFIGVYPQGENGWSTGPKDTNNCDYTDYDCTTDPNETVFLATIISEVQGLGANGSVYIAGNSNGAALAHFAATNAGTSLPIKGIITTVTQLLSSPERVGPGPLNYVNPGTLSGQGPKVSVMNVMGTEDGLIPYAGGSSAVFGGNDDFQLMSALDSMEAWASHNGCDLEAKTKTVETDTKAGGDGTGVFYEWKNCGGGTIVEHYAINGANHGAGNSSVDGEAIKYDITADFIGRCEDSDPTPTVAPRPTPLPKPTTEPPSKAPAPTNPDECVDDPDWRGKFNNDHDCDFVGENPKNRCGWESRDGVKANEACPKSCDTCTKPPSKAPAPTNPDECVDDPDWRGKFNNDHDCDFVGKNPKNRCGWESRDGVKANEACPKSCDTCEDDSDDTSNPPSPAPVCPEGESLFAIEFQADDNSTKDNMYLLQKQVKKGNKNRWRKVKKRKKLNNNDLHEFDTCLDSSLCYRFRMKDTSKNGLCCGGYYNIYYENEELEHEPFDDSFTDKFQNTRFGNC